MLEIIFVQEKMVELNKISKLSDFSQTKCVFIYVTRTLLVRTQLWRPRFRGTLTPWFLMSRLGTWSPKLLFRPQLIV